MNEKGILRNMAMIFMASIVSMIVLPVAVMAAGTVHNVNTSMDYSTIQSAIDAAGAGNEIHVDSGTYYENVNVSKRLILRGIDNGGGKPKVDAMKNGSAIILSAGNSTVEGFNALNSSQGYAAGIYVLSNNNTISNNNVSGNENGRGIYLYQSHNNKIINNIALSDAVGIYLEYSMNNVVDGNIAKFNSLGIMLNYAGNNMLNNNIADLNAGSGIDIHSSNYNELNNNTANSQTNDCYHVSCEPGIYLYYSNYNILIENTASENYGAGIGLIYSSGNNLSNNTVLKNKLYGINIDSSSSNNNLTGNEVLYNQYGFYVSSSNNNTMIGNNISNSYVYGIYMGYSDHNTLVGNIILNNDYHGIRIYSSRNNTLVGNIISNNSYGVYIDYLNSALYYFNNNIVAENNIIGNINSNAYDMGINQWDNGIKGNYWNDYIGTDADSDGIGDVPYNISGGLVQDRYPLMAPHVSTPTPSSLNVNITLPINNFYSEEKVNFSGNASGGVPPYTYTWTSNRIAGSLNSTTTSSITDEFNKTLAFNNETQEMNKHTITLTVTDNVGTIATKTTELNVVKQKIKVLVVPVSAKDTIFSLEDQSRIIKLADSTKKYYENSSYGAIYLNFTDGPLISSFVNPPNLLGTDKGEVLKAVAREVLPQLSEVEKTQYNTVLVAYTGINDLGVSWASGQIPALMGGDSTWKSPQTLIVVPAGSNTPFGIWVHEEGHSLGNTVLTSEAHFDPDLSHLGGSLLYGGDWSNGCPDLYNCGKNVYAWDVMAKGGAVYNSSEINRINQPTDMSIVSKIKLGWLKKNTLTGLGSSFFITSTENMHYGDNASVYKTRPFSNIEYYIEAREPLHPSIFRAIDDSWTPPKIIWFPLVNGILVYKIINEPSGYTVDVQRSLTRYFSDESSVGPSILASDGISASVSDCVEYVKFDVIASHQEYPYYVTVQTSEPGFWCSARGGAVLIGEKVWSVLKESFSPDENMSTVPYLHLHAITPEGLHIGPNRTSGGYDMQIPGGIASGDMIGEEWIFVPTGTNVSYYVDSHDVQQYLVEHPEVNASNATMNYSVTHMEYGENPQRVELSDGNWTVQGRIVSVPQEGSIAPGLAEEMNTTPIWTRYINGTVIDNATKTGIAGVTVSTSTGITVKTNELGAYSLEVNIDIYDLRVELNPTHYANNSMTVSTVDSSIVLPDIELTEKPTGTITGGVTIK